MTHNHYPIISIVIPTYARPHHLCECLRSICRLDYPKEAFEVIVVDDGSPSPLQDVVAPFQEMLNIVLLRQKQRGPGMARNTGAQAARGDIVAFTDDDCMPHPDWLKKICEYIQVKSIAVIGGRTENHLSDNLCSEASQMLIDYLGSYYNRISERARFFTSNNMIFPREDFLKIGGFHSDFSIAGGEDREITDRWIYFDKKSIFAPDVVVRHAHDLNLRSFWRQHFNYGRGAYHFHKLRAERMNNRYKIQMEPVSFYWRLIGYPLSRSRHPRSLFIAVLLVLSQVANAVGFFWEASESKNKKNRRERAQLELR